MVPIDIFLILLTMFLSVIIPGYFISKLIVKESTSEERFALSLAFGTFPVYIAYSLVKNGLFYLNINTVFFSLVFFICVYLIFGDGRERTIQWLFASGNS